MTDSARPASSEALSRTPLFWQLQLIGWGGFELVSLPLKQMVYGSMSAGLWITAYQLPLSLLLTLLLRSFFRLTQPTQRVVWQAVVLVLAGCATASCADVLITLAVNRALGFASQSEVIGVGLYVFRTALYAIWSLGYFLAKALLRSRDQAFSAAVAEEKHRLEILRYQLNPGFIAKSLATINREIGENPLTARAMTARLADYCQNTFRPSGPGHTTTIGDEIALLRTYLEIERLHQPETLQIHFDVDSSLMTHPLPPILLLPLAEKAIREGRGTAAQPLQITITVQRTPDGQVLLEVANSGRLTGSRPPMLVAPTDHEVGDVRTSLERYFPGRHRFTLTQDSFKARATLCLPLAG